ncbi:hypothetical protein OKW37_001739 [Paraburkholderia sp. MM5482-R2]
MLPACSVHQTSDFYVNVETRGMRVRRRPACGGSAHITIAGRSDFEQPLLCHGCLGCLLKWRLVWNSQVAYPSRVPDADDHEDIVQSVARFIKPDSPRFARPSLPEYRWQLACSSGRLVHAGTGGPSDVRGTSVAALRGSSPVFMSCLPFFSSMTTPTTAGLCSWLSKATAIKLCWRKTARTH